MICESVMSVRGIGGVFFKSEDPKKLQEWYVENLGLKPDEGGYIYFMWSDLKAPGYTLWAPFPADTKYFEPSTKHSMINFVVDKIEDFVVELKNKGIDVVDKIEKTEQGKFTWLMDPEGNRIELWEPANK
ncbi:MAG: VOC family protein [Candidatus Thorarchaeota archaeon]|nr:VOC family protein [Candidatus Thorarchaeota archaeon]